MVDLTAEMAGLWRALGNAPSHRGRLILFAGGKTGEGTSTIAREFARLAAARARKPVWLIDADLDNQIQVEAIDAQPDRFGKGGERVAGSPDGSCFFTIAPPVKMHDGRVLRPAQLLSAKPFLGRRLFVTRFHQEALLRGQKTIVLGQGDYWNALAAHAETIVIDAPASDRSDAALALAPFVDAVAIVISEGADVSAPLAFKEQIEIAGGNVKGIIINRAKYQPPKLLRKVLG